MIDECWQFPHPVDRLARSAVGAGDGPGAAAEYTNFAHLKYVYPSDHILLS